MTIIDLIEFLKSGAIKGIEYGISREDLTAILGHTDCVYRVAKKDRYPSILKYDKVEFYFSSSEDNRLHGIMIQPNVQPAGEGRIGFEYGWISENMTFQDVEQCLKSNGIHFLVTSDTEVSPDIITSGHVSFLFYDEATPLLGKNELCKIGRFVDLPTLNEAKTS